jgi:class 3 adenylate cyclase
MSSHPVGKTLTTRHSHEILPRQVRDQPLYVRRIRDMASPSTNLTTILFADIAGSTRLYDTFGDFKATRTDFRLPVPAERTGEGK